MKSSLTDSLTLLLVATGTALVTFLGATTLDLATIETLFLSFVAAIISLHLIPAIELIVDISRGMFGREAKHHPLQKEPSGSEREQSS